MRSTRTASTAMPPSLPRVISTLLLGVALSAAQAGPGAHGPNGEHLDGPTTAASPSGLARLPDGSVNVPMAAQRRMGVRTVLAPLTEAAASQLLSGRVMADPNASGRVQAAHGGRVEPGPNGLPVAGQVVRRGAVLAYLVHHAQPYAEAQQRAQAADLQTQRLLAEQRVARLQGLEGTVPRKDMDAAQAELHGLRNREQHIRSSIGSREALLAPISGVIAQVDLQAGQVVEPRDLLVQLLDPSRLLVEATTTDASLASQIAGAQLQGVAGVSLKLLGAGRVLRDGVLPLTFSVRLDRAGQPGEAGGALPLAVGQPVTLVVASTAKATGIVLPAQAVVRNAANEAVVWIKTGAERFVAQAVVLRPLDSQTVLVTSGLAPNNRVVVQGAPLIAQIR